MHFEAEPRKGICGPSCFAIRDGEIFHPITPNPAPFLRPRSFLPPPAPVYLSPDHPWPQSPPKASFSVEPLSLTIRRSWNLCVPIPLQTHPLHIPSTGTLRSDLKTRSATGSNSVREKEEGEVVNRYPHIHPQCLLTTVQITETQRLK